MSVPTYVELWIAIPGLSRALAMREAWVKFLQVRKSETINVSFQQEYSALSKQYPDEWIQFVGLYQMGAI